MTGDLVDFDGQRLGLYFDLQDGKSADLEVIAKASVAWVEALRAAVIAIEPDADFRVKVINAQEGSLLIQTIIDWVDNQVDAGATWYDGLPRSRKIMLMFAVFMIFTAGPAYLAYAEYFGDKPSDEDAIIEKRLQADPDIMRKKRAFYRELEQDPAIKGVGLKRDVRSKPQIYVGSEHFAEAGGLWADQEQDAQERTTSTVVDVVLVKPALIAEPRTWEFEAPGIGRFPAIMRDPAVLRAMGEAGLPERLREGIPMRIRLQVREIANDGSWKVAPRGRVVLNVISPQLD